jgi:3-methyladenine DNA glycosylase Tag
MPEMQAPEKVRAETPGDYLEVMSKAVFQSGMSWKVVESKWAGIRDAFRHFDAAAVASLSDTDIDEIARDPRVIRNRRKLEAIRENAHRVLERASEHGSFGAYLRSHGDFEDTVSALREDFKFLGDLGAYYFLYVVGEPVPDHEAWMRSRGR